MFFHILKEIQQNYIDNMYLDKARRRRRFFRGIWGVWGAKPPRKFSYAKDTPPPLKVWKSVRRGGILSDIWGYDFKVLSKELCPQVKISEIFFANSISASSHRILMTTI